MTEKTRQEIMRLVVRLENDREKIGTMETEMRTADSFQRDALRSILREFTEDAVRCRHEIFRLIGA